MNGNNLFPEHKIKNILFIIFQNSHNPLCLAHTRTHRIHLDRTLDILHPDNIRNSYSAFSATLALDLFYTYESQIIETI